MLNNQHFTILGSVVPGGLFLIYCSGVKRIENVSLFSSYSLHSQLLIAP